MTWCLSLVSYSILCVNLLYKKHPNKPKGINYFTNDPFLVKSKVSKLRSNSKTANFDIPSFFFSCEFANKAYRLKQNKVKQVGLG